MLHSTSGSGIFRDCLPDSFDQHSSHGNDSLCRPALVVLLSVTCEGLKGEHKVREESRKSNGELWRR